jgi:hypothetical protein
VYPDLQVEDIRDALKFAAKTVRQSRYQTTAELGAVECLKRDGRRGRQRRGPVFEPCGGVGKYRLIRSMRYDRDLRFTGRKVVRKAHDHLSPTGLSI